MRSCLNPFEIRVSFERINIVNVGIRAGGLNPFAIRVSFELLRH